MIILLTGGTGKIGSKLIKLFNDNRIFYENIDRNKATKIIHCDDYLEKNILNHRIYFDEIIFIHAATVYEGEYKLINKINFNLPVKIINFKNINIIQIINLDSFFTVLEIDNNFNYLNNYIKTKKDFKNYLLQKKNLKIPIINLKIFHVIDFNKDGNRFFDKLINSLILNNEIKLTSCLSNRNFIYISDIINLILKVVFYKFENRLYEFDLAMNDRYDFKTIILGIHKELNSKSKLFFNYYSDRNEDKYIEKILPKNLLSNYINHNLYTINEIIIDLGQKIKNE